MQLSLGPIDLRYYTGQNWSSFELAFVTARQAGVAKRETALRTSFKSEHLVEAFGEERESDSCILNGTTYHGKVVRGADGDEHYISALQVAARAEHQATLRKGLRQADAMAISVDAQSVEAADGAQPV